MILSFLCSSLFVSKRGPKEWWRQEEGHIKASAAAAQLGSQSTAAVPRPELLACLFNALGGANTNYLGEGPMLQTYAILCP